MRPRRPQAAVLLALCLAAPVAAQNVAPAVGVTDPVVFTLSQGAFTTQIQAVERAGDAAAFYDYFSTSSHTGFERARESKVFLYRDTATGMLSLFFTHNIDRDTSGIATGNGQARFDLSPLPPGTFLQQSDDPMAGPRSELDLNEEPEGLWNWVDNTDGGVIGGFPADVPWCVTITPLRFQNVTSWVYHYASGASIALDMSEPVTICFQPATSADRLDVDEGNVASLAAAFDDPDALDVHVATWDFGDGTTAPATFSPGPGATHHDVDPVFHAYGDDGTFTAAIDVTDSAGGSGRDEIDVVVRNVAPGIAPAGPFLASAGLPATLVVTGSDPGSDDLTFTWDFGDGSPASTSVHYNDAAGPDPLPSPSGAFPFVRQDAQTHVWCEPGLRIVTVGLADDDGGASEAAFTVDVEPGPGCNEPPECSAGPAVGGTCGAFLLSATASDPDGDALTFAWSSTCAGVGFSPGPDVLQPAVSLDGACDETCDVRLVVTDPAGARCESATLLVVRDDVRPIVTSCPGDVVVECDGSGNAASRAAWIAAFAAEDDCSAVTVASTGAVMPDCGGASAEARTFTATDACGNAASCPGTFTIVDTTAPVLAGVPPDGAVACDAVPPPASPTALDACDPVPAIAFTEVRADGACAFSYVLTRTWTATDACGNAVSASRDVVVSDTEAPILAGVPADVVAACDAVPAPASPSASDACDPSPSLAFAELRLDGPCPGTYELRRTWTAADACGNASSAGQVVSVRDVTPPVVAAGTDVVACVWPPRHAMTAFGRETFAPIIADDCSGPVTWRFAGCVSDQPDDGLGDGHTSDDCAASPDGSAILVRSERQGMGEAGRRYGVAIVAVDACGNESAATVIGSVLVPHDRRAHPECATAGKR